MLAGGRVGMSSNLDVRGTEARRSHRSLHHLELGIDAATGRHLDAIRGCVGTDLQRLSVILPQRHLDARGVIYIIWWRCLRHQCQLVKGVPPSCWQGRAGVIVELDVQGSGLGAAISALFCCSSASCSAVFATFRALVVVVLVATLLRVLCHDEALLALLVGCVPRRR
jgi:hypothetical protein